MGAIGAGLVSSAGVIYAQGNALAALKTQMHSLSVSHAQDSAQVREDVAYVRSRIDQVFQILLAERPS
jgi:hypothetical protein